MKRHLEKARAALEVWKASRKKRIEPLRRSLDCKPAFDLEYFRESVLYRFVELAEATFVLLDAGNYLGAVITVRSLEETSSVIWYLNDLCEEVIDNRELIRFTEQWKRLALGWKGQNEFPEALQILNLIDKANKKLPGYRGHYDRLSEYLHPNWKGTMGLFAKTGGIKLKVEFGRYIRGKMPLLVHIETALLNTIDLLQLAESEYESMAGRFRDACSELHKEGKLKKQINYAEE